MKKRVVIIGGGASGLSMLWAFQQGKACGKNIPEIVCFEKLKNLQDNLILGLVDYTNFISKNKSNAKEITIRTSIGKECLEFPDYTFDEHFKWPTCSFPTRAEIYEYIWARAEEHNLCKQITFSMEVQHVKPKKDKFEVSVVNIENGEVNTSIFDYVIVASGQSSIPYIPQYDGLNSFLGDIFHINDFNLPKTLKRKNIVIIGNSFSAQEFALHAHKFLCKSVTLVYRNKPVTRSWPATVREMMGPITVKGKRVKFKDGSSVNADVIIYCTGKSPGYPFIDKSLRRCVKRTPYPKDLFKGVVYVNNPDFFYIGTRPMVTFNLFDLQALYVKDVIMRKIELPSEAELYADIDKWSTKWPVCLDWLQRFELQTQYAKDLCQYVDHSNFYLDELFDYHKKNEHNRKTDIQTYRDKIFTSLYTGTVAIKA